MAQKGKSRDDEWEELDISGSKSGGLAGAMKKLKRWAKENPNLVKGLAAGALLLLMVLFFGWQLGWFSGGGQKAPTAAAPQPPQMPPPAQTTPVAAPPQLSKSPGQNPPEQPKKDQPAKEQPRPLPDDISTWKKEDYFRARQQNDPKLLLAIAYLTEKAPGSEAVAQGLTELLKPLPAETPPAAGPTPGATPPGPGAAPPGPSPMPPGAGRMPPGPGALPPGPGPSPMPPGAMRPERGALPPGPGPMPPSGAPRNPAELTKLVETIVAALGDNGSEPARKALEQILAGTLTTDDDKAAVEAALKALVAHPSATSDALLLRVLTAPEALRPADREGPWPAKDLQAKAFELIKTSVSGALRTKLAEVLPDRPLRATATNPVRDLLLATDPLNCGAQKVLYEKESANKEVKSELKGRLEQQLTGYSAAALARFLKVPSDVQSGGGRFSPAGGMPDRLVNPAGGTPDKTG